MSSRLWTAGRRSGDNAVTSALVSFSALLRPVSRMGPRSYTPEIASPAATRGWSSAIATRWAPADQPESTTGPEIPYDSPFWASQSSDWDISVTISVNKTSGASEYPGMATDQPWAATPSTSMANTSRELRCQ